jgi:hypothetical protein
MGMLEFDADIGQEFDADIGQIQCRFLFDVFGSKSSGYIDIIVEQSALR